ncbi:penicillin-insensitive murein endopeptidase [Chondromyces apiculatus]|uniref:Murein endopeptidase n=1 Tax=Chondromyces apiculatus DSM 436 TaxID=1192034 RepID=A0A017THB0_9BACT|nr:penicillin-insensitive murein endopeptidase [Chondromyces apiculatus]EYF08619.1 Hypothetical protein CAP_4149 [Chondromyces apiculatus DSM 436]
MYRSILTLCLSAALLLPGAQPAAAAGGQDKETPASGKAPRKETPASSKVAGNGGAKARKPKPGKKPVTLAKSDASRGDRAKAEAMLAAELDEAKVKLGVVLDAAKARFDEARAKAEAPKAGALKAKPAATVLPKPKTAASPKAAPKVKASSVGHPNDGHLEGGVQLDTARKDIRVVPAYAGDSARWGMPELVQAIERAARGVNKRFPGSVLDVGDLSRRTGGDIAGHGSHESGRDVDLGLYAVDAKGRQVHAREFIRFGADLRAVNAPGARLDAGRSWLLVQELLTDPRARVSHIFVSRPVRDALVAEAKRRGVSRALLTRAQLAMMQPTGAEAHDDHLHVRISCPRGDGKRCVELAKNAPMGGKVLATKAKVRETGVTSGAKVGVKGAKGEKAEKGAKAEAKGAKADAKADAKAEVKGAKADAKGAKGEKTASASAAARADVRGKGGEARKGEAGDVSAEAAAEARKAARRERVLAVRSRSSSRRGGDAPVASGRAWQVPMMLDAIDDAILQPLGLAPASSEPEAASDGAEVRDAVDESGAPKITD